MRDTWSYYWRNVWRALITRTGLISVGLALLGLGWVARIAGWITAVWPSTAPWLTPLVPYCMALVAGWLLRGAIINQFRIAQEIDYLPILKLRDKAAKLGWDFESGEGFDLFDLGDAVRQAGLNGSIILYGRQGQRQFPELWGPFQEIPREHWRDHDIPDILLHQAPDNSEVITVHDVDLHQPIYWDIQVDREPALWWLKNIAPRLRGERAKLEAEKRRRRR